MTAQEFVNLRVGDKIIHRESEILTVSEIGDVFITFTDYKDCLALRVLRFIDDYENQQHEDEKKDFHIKHHYGIAFLKDVFVEKEVYDKEIEFHKSQYAYLQQLYDNLKVYIAAVGSQSLQNNKIDWSLRAHELMLTGRHTMGEIETIINKQKDLLC